LPLLPHFHGYFAADALRYVRACHAIIAHAMMIRHYFRYTALSLRHYDIAAISLRYIIDILARSVMSAAV